jgi:hypothetical protein
MVYSRAYARYAAYIKWYACSFMSPRDLSEKFDEMKEESPYKCSLCDRAFRNRQEGI